MLGTAWSTYISGEIRDEMDFQSCSDQRSVGPSYIIRKDPAPFSDCRVEGRSLVCDVKTLNMPASTPWRTNI